MAITWKDYLENRNLPIQTNYIVNNINKKLKERGTGEETRR